MSTAQTQRRQVVSVETSTPKARAFVEALLGSADLRGADYSLTSRELRAIVNGDDLSDLTQPMSEPFPDVIQDLWQLSHLTTSYVARAAAGAILLATGIIDDNPVAIVVAALFLPFLAEVLAVSFGLWSRDRRLILRGLRAVAVSTALAFAAGALVAAIQGGPIHFTAFKSPLASLCHLGGDRHHGGSLECRRHRPPLSHRRGGGGAVGHFSGLARSGDGHRRCRRGRSLVAPRELSDQPGNDLARGRRGLRRSASAARTRLDSAAERTRGVTPTRALSHRAARARLRFFLLGNFRSGLSRLTQSDSNGLLAAFHFLAAAGFQRALFMFLHDFMNLARALGTGGEVE